MQQTAADKIDIWEGAGSIMGTADDRNGKPPSKFLQMGHIHSADLVWDWPESVKHLAGTAPRPPPRRASTPCPLS